MTPDERAAVRKRAAARARAMGYRTDPPPDGAPAALPDDDQEQPVVLPAVGPRVLRQLLGHGHLTPAQADAARRRLTAAAQFARDEDAA